MPFVTIRHITTYRYRRPVAFGEHRMMLHPRDSHDQRVIEADLRISPEPRSLRFVQDAFGNHVGIARFSRRSKELIWTPPQPTASRRLDQCARRAKITGRPLVSAAIRNSKPALSVPY